MSDFYLKWSEVAQLCPTLCNPMNCSLPGSSVHGIFQARILEWVAISFSRGSSQPRDRTLVFCVVGRRFTIWDTREAPLHSKGDCKQDEKTTLRVGENIWKQSNWQINLQNIQTVHAVQYQKSKQPNLKIGGRPKQTFLQGRHPDGHSTVLPQLTLVMNMWVCLNYFLHPRYTLYNCMNIWNHKDPKR